MTQKGSHTWDLVLRYHLCPKCKRIIESRKDYTYSSGKYVKDLNCTHCGHEFTLIQTRKSQSFPLFGSEQPIEWDWPSN